MLPAFNMLAASIIALAWLAIALLFPILAVWFGVRVARDLRRIADALSTTGIQTRETADPWPAGSWDEYQHLKRGVSNSMFGR